LENVDDLGAEFMQDVFALGDEETGVAMNRPKTIAFAVPVDAAERRDPQALRDEILIKPHLATCRQTYGLASQRVQETLRSDWGGQLEKECQFEWEIEPERLEDSR